MAFTLDKEQKLKAAGLIEFFDEDQTPWRELAKKSYPFVQGNFPPIPRSATMMLRRS